VLGRDSTGSDLVGKMEIEVLVSAGWRSGDLQMEYPEQVLLRRDAP